MSFAPGRPGPAANTHAREGSLDHITQATMNDNVLYLKVLTLLLYR